MTNQIQSQNVKKIYNLADRTAKFGEEIILFIKTLSKDDISRHFSLQLVRSATSIGANYMEADCAESNKDFKHKIGICKKESKESTHWLHMIAINNSDKKETCRILWQEAHELTLIFSTIVNSTNKTIEATNL